MSWSQIKEELECFEKDLEALIRTEDVMSRYGLKSTILFESVKSSINENIEEVKEKACWFGIRSEIDDLAKRLTKDPTPDCFTVKTPTMSALIGYIRHLETKAGVTNDRD